MPLTPHLGNVETLVLVDLDCVRPLPGRALPITYFLFLPLFSSFLLIWRLDLAGCLIPAQFLWDITYSHGEPAVFESSLFGVISPVGLGEGFRVRIWRFPIGLEFWVWGLRVLGFRVLGFRV